MLINHNPDDYEVVTTHHTCDYHKRNPKNTNWPGCTCSGSYGYRRKKLPKTENKKPIDQGG